MREALFSVDEEVGILCLHYEFKNGLFLEAIADKHNVRRKLVRQVFKTRSHFRSELELLSIVHAVNLSFDVLASQDKHEAAHLSDLLSQLELDVLLIEFIRN